MKLTHIVLIVIFLAITGFSCSSKSQKFQPSKGEQLVNSILANAAKIIKEKYNIKPSGMGAAMPGGPIQKLALCFDTKYPYTKEQLRELLIKLTIELLDKINEDNNIQEFLKERPFTIRNIQIIIYNHDKDGRGLQDPEISTAQILESNLTYRTIDPQDPFKFKNEFKETYEEALQAISKP